MIFVKFVCICISLEKVWEDVLRDEREIFSFLFWLLVLGRLFSFLKFVYEGE